MTARLFSPYRHWQLFGVHDTSLRNYILCWHFEDRKFCYSPMIYYPSEYIKSMLLATSSPFCPSTLFASFNWFFIWIGASEFYSLHQYLHVRYETFISQICNCYSLFIVHVLGAFRSLNNYDNSVFYFSIQTKSTYIHQFTDYFALS